MKLVYKTLKRLPYLILFFIPLMFSGCEDTAVPGARIYPGPCIAGSPAPIINFKLVDKVTGADLFFDKNPLPITDVMLIYNLGQEIKPLIVEDKTAGKYFQSYIGQFAVKIGNLPKIDIVVTSVTVSHPDKCPTAVNTKVEYNGYIETGIENKMILIKVDTSAK